MKNFIKKKVNINTMKLDDDIVIKIIMDNIGLNAIYDIQKLNYKYRNEVLKKLINIKGTTVKQISRITGISTKIIEKVKNYNK